MSEVFSALVLGAIAKAHQTGKVAQVDKGKCSNCKTTVEPGSNFCGECSFTVIPLDDPRLQ